MIEVCDTVAFDVMPEVVWSWLESMPDHYLAWHPDLLGAWWVRGGAFVPGVMEVQEVLHGEQHRLRMALAKAGPGRWIGYWVLPGLSGEFGVSPVSCGSEFTAVIEFGVRAPVIGPIAGWLVRGTVGTRIGAIGHHARGAPN